MKVPDNNVPPSLLLIDAQTLLEDPGLVPRILRKGGAPVLTASTLAALTSAQADGNQNIDAASMLAGWLGRIAQPDCERLPNGRAASDVHRISRHDFRGGNVFVIHGRNGAALDSDAMLAKRYELILMSVDAKRVNRAKTEGAQAVRKVNATGARKAPGALPSPAAPRVCATPQDFKPFAVLPRPASMTDKRLPLSCPVDEGSTVYTGKGKALRLTRLISSGGEGGIFQSSDPALVCKIYHADKLTRLRNEKIKLMLSRPLKREGLCWPVDVVHNDAGEFVGYVMPRAEGKPMQTAMFVKPVLLKTFPNWTRADLVKLSIAFLEHVAFLHSYNVLIGDINPLNLLVSADSTRLSIVDTDSFQIEGFPCPVGTINFTPPELQGKAYADFMRTKEDELFAVATMLFMIMHPGKPPYSQQGGGTPSENIQKRLFPYGIGTGGSSNKAPEGPWFRIWKNLPLELAKKFEEVFGQNKRVGLDVWLTQMRAYQSRLQRGKSDNELFPVRKPVRDGVMATCECGQQELASRKRLESLRQDGKSFLCSTCYNRIRMEILARKNRRAAPLAHSRGAAKAHPARPAPSPAAPPSTRGPIASPPSSSFPSDPVENLTVLARYIIGRLF